MNKAVLRKSERAYGFILKFYPKSFVREFGVEMSHVFINSLKDAHAAQGKRGVIGVWLRTVMDAGKSLATQHLESRKGGNDMKTKGNDIIMQNKIFLWIALATGGILMVPLVTMQFTSEVNWTPGDFLVMGILLFGTGFLFVCAARVVPRKYRTLVGIAFAAVFLYLWAELAVGIFTNWGS